MVSAKHTSGPWKIGDQYGPVMDEIQAADGKTIAAVWTHRGRSPMRSPTHRREANPVEEWVANARLIAAAPDLLEALEDWMRVVDVKDCSLYCEETQLRIKKAVAAIAKAKGEA